MTPVDPISHSDPTVGCIRYQGGFKYQLTEGAMVVIPIKPEKDITTTFVCLNTKGELVCKAGFAWNGVSGPTIDRASNARGGCFHDALYRLIRFGLLPLSCREVADEALRTIWIEDGMWPWLANLEVMMVKKFGAGSARPSAEPKVKIAP